MRRSSPVETGFRAVLNATIFAFNSDEFEMHTKFLFYTRDELNSDEFNAERCQPGSNLGRHFLPTPVLTFFEDCLMSLKPLYGPVISQKVFDGL